MRPPCSRVTVALKTEEGSAAPRFALTPSSSSSSDQAWRPPESSSRLTSSVTGLGLGTTGSYASQSAAAYALRIRLVHAETRGLGLERPGSRGVGREGFEPPQLSRVVYSHLSSPMPSRPTQEE